MIIVSSPASLATRVAATKPQRAALPANTVEVLERCEREGTTKNLEYLKAVQLFYKRHMCRLDAFPPVFWDALNAAQADGAAMSTLYAGSFVPTGSMRSYDAVDQLERITAKTVPGGVLLVNGDFDTAQDEVMTPFFTQMKARVKWVRFAASSHTPFFEETESFLRAMADFLRS